MSAVRDHLKSTLAACALGLGLLAAGAVATPAAAKPAQAAKSSKPAARAKAKAKPVQLATPVASPAVTGLVAGIIASHDNGGLPFVVIDKHKAAVFVFNADGSPNGAVPVLLGYAAGDDSVPGIGKRPIEKIKPGERTTPAGRFLTSFRPNGGKKKSLWMDYDAAVALHPLRELSRSGPREGRWQRLKSPSPADNRITYGCINVPDAFFDEVVTPAFKQRGGIVYVLPETRALAEIFPSLGVTEAAAVGPSTGGR
ncbi:hypothetical protein [Caulobacter sp. 17J80-11]|uniref:hypothetical protein n=1 Tax=Caulobacter sp. 17J80-11 TaxID=2763502 RepID=UPI0016538597|nr:hypothetical protein [Caulobacter sp. 17J80-11]MBC6981212.1 hypothetical protein [Caulobacter sp. 17J80-11]